MIPTEEEKQKIQEAQLVNPDIPLGSAEQFLLTLSSITELSARLQLWAFKMDYELIEKVRHISCFLHINHMQIDLCRSFPPALQYDMLLWIKGMVGYFGEILSPHIPPWEFAKYEATASSCLA